MLAAAVHSVVVWLGFALSSGAAYAAPIDTTLGAYEIAPFDTATNAAAAHAAKATASGKLVSVAGGGDTVAALNKAGASDDFTYISTAGGAFLEWMEGKVLPGVAALG